jgi:hypothetical protein
MLKLVLRINSNQQENEIEDKLFVEKFINNMIIKLNIFVVAR